MTDMHAVVIPKSLGLVTNLHDHLGFMFWLIVKLIYSIVHSYL